MTQVTICDRCKKQITHNDQAILNYNTTPLWPDQIYRKDLCLACWKYVLEYIETDPKIKLED